MPDEAAQAEALSGIKKRFESAYDKSRPHARLALAAQLILESHGAADVPAQRYVLLDEARTLAERERDLDRKTVSRVAPGRTTRGFLPWRE